MMPLLYTQQEEATEYPTSTFSITDRNPPLMISASIIQILSEYLAVKTSAPAAKTMFTSGTSMI